MDSERVTITLVEKPEPMFMDMASSILQNGGLVAFPTETVYGLGGDALNPDSAELIYSTKGRPSDKPLIVHIADLSALEHLALPESCAVAEDAFYACKSLKK